MASFPTTPLQLASPPEDLFEDATSRHDSEPVPNGLDAHGDEDTAGGGCGDDDDHQSQSDPENDDFYFESDHLALRGNVDYTAVLRTIAILHTQRIQASKDIDRLAIAERQALDDPDAFVRRLTAGELHMPGAISVADLPKVHFEKYGVSIPEFVEEEQKTTDANDLTVRGRMFDQTKPETFNQLWTCEEQKRLEELLVEYPPEPIEMRRIAKIARALGNRTTKQVASRLQKYFKKLHSAGMPVPGRIPKSNRGYISKANRIHKQALRPTTFFPANHVPFTIVDEDDYGSGAVPLDPNWYRKGCSRQSVDSNGREKDVVGAGAMRTYVVDGESDGEGGGAGGNETRSEEELVLKLLGRVKRDKEREAKMESSRSEHDGFMCDYCSEEPIMGTRWNCRTCVRPSVDFCTDCLLTQLQAADRHPIRHTFVGLRVSLIDSTVDPYQCSRVPSDAESDDYQQHDSTEPTDVLFTAVKDEIFDKDYRFSKPEYNYLDPNFLPQ